MVPQIHISTDPYSNRVRCDGLAEYVRMSGITVVKLNQISGMARNTIKKVISGDLVKRSTAETLINKMINAGMFPEAAPLGFGLPTPPKDNVFRLKPGTPLSEDEVSETSKPDVYNQIVAIRLALRKLRGKYQDLFDDLDNDPNASFRDELQMLKPHWGQLAVLHEELMAQKGGAKAD